MTIPATSTSDNNSNPQNKQGMHHLYIIKRKIYRDCTAPVLRRRTRGLGAVCTLAATDLPRGVLPQPPA